MADDHDEGADDDHHEEAGPEMAEDAGGAERHGAEEIRQGSNADRDEGEPLPPAGEPAQPERPAFSLFSWMRRDPVPRPSPTEDDEAAPGRTKPDPLE
jgi:hypothetical protein